MDIAFGISYNVRTNEAWPGAADAFNKGWRLCPGWEAWGWGGVGWGQASPLPGTISLANLCGMRLCFQVLFPACSKYQMTP